MQKKIQIKILVSEIIASELAPLNCLYYEGNTCHGREVNALTNSFKTLHIIKRDFFQPLAFTMINNYAKGGAL